MVDYLENVCLHKYEKIHKKEASKDAVYCDNSEQEPMRPHPAKAVPTTRPQPEIQPPAMPEPYEVPDVTTPIRAIERIEKNIQKEAVRETAKENLKEAYKKEEKKQDKDVLIRQILEEFMA